jgi:hypothetical protein
MYRCVTQNGTDGEVICIGDDENQGGKDYNGVGKWCEFTFLEIPELTLELNTYVQENFIIMKSMLKVVSGEVVCKTLAEVQ